MSQFMPASEMILRHSAQLDGRKLLLAGDIQDKMACELGDNMRVWCGYYQQWRMLSPLLKQRVCFALLVDPDWLRDCEAVIYFWPKNKQEALFQLRYLLSVMPKGCELWISGENRSGVRSVETLLADNSTSQKIVLNKIDTARRCSLYFAQPDQSASFSLDSWWHRYCYQQIEVAALPGVFSQQEMDSGSQLLLSTLQTPLSGKVLDIGCGAGVIAAAVGKRADLPLQLTLSDVSAAAIASSQATMQANGLECRIIASDLFSAIDGRFDLILSNPPFHNGLKTTLDITRRLITEAAQHLNTGGELRIVANAFLPYPQWLDQSFGKHQVVAQNSRFKVYSAKVSGRQYRAGEKKG